MQLTVANHMSGLQVYMVVDGVQHYPYQINMWIIVQIYVYLSGNASIVSDCYSFVLISFLPRCEMAVTMTP